MNEKSFIIIIIIIIIMKKKLWKTEITKLIYFTNIYIT